MCFTDMPFIGCVQKMLYFRKLREAINPRVEVEDGDLQLQYWFFDKLYTSHYFMHGGSRRTRTLEFKVFQRTNICNPVFVGWHLLRHFALPQWERHRIYNRVTPSWQKLETHRMLCVSTRLMFAYYLGAFRNIDKPLSQLLRETAITKYSVMPLGYFVWAAEFGVANLILPDKLCAL